MRALIYLVAYLASCSDPPPPVNPDEPTIPPSKLRATCVDACLHLSELGCPDAQPTPDGASCSEVCESLPIRPACLASVTICEQTAACWE